ncbi:MAG: hypothetical protein NTY95_11165 [Bacteroidia bacterium]|nr:hypothetical protein [Bacteroidia bacterium]
MFKISREHIIKYANKFDEVYGLNNDSITENELKKKIKSQDCLTKDDFLKIGRWKSPRPIKYYESNSKSLIKKITTISFHTKHEKIKIEALTILKGCHYPLASVILHFKYPTLYPIIDFRALWSLWGMEHSITYTFELWWKYVEEIRKISKSCNLDCRTIDKALWKYSEEHQE